MYESNEWSGNVVWEDRVPEVVVGRFPVLHAAEFNVLTSKMIACETATGDDWAARMALVADDGNHGSAFHADSDDIAALVPVSYPREEVYLNALPIGQARSPLRSAITNGAVRVSYIGCGGLDRLVQEGVLLAGVAAGLLNGGRNPISTALTRWVGRFSVLGNDACGKLLAHKPAGGMVAIRRPSGLSMNRQVRRSGEGFAWVCFQDRVSKIGEMIPLSMENCRGAEDPLYMLRIHKLFGEPAQLMKCLLKHRGSGCHVG